MNTQINGPNNISSDLAKFAGKIGAKQFTFFSLIKLTITISVFFAMFMLIVK